MKKQKNEFIVPVDYASNAELPVPSFEKVDAYELSGDMDDSFVTTLRGIKDWLQIPDDATVIYPGSSVHVGVARVFGKENVVHVDPDEIAARSLSGADYMAVESTIEEYIPEEPVDVMVALNSYGKITDTILERLLKPGGLVIANNYTHWAHDLSEMPGVTLESAVLPSYGDVNASYLEGGDIPVNACGLTVQYWRISREGRIEVGTPEDNTFAEKSPNYPDGLFVFRAG